MRRDRKNFRQKITGLLILASIHNVLCIEPYFDVAATNVTVVAGGTAILPCSVKELGSHSVVWMSPKSNPLIFKFKRVTEDTRFSLDQPYPQEWNLHIQNVRLSDRGKYRCIVNTKVSKFKTVNLIVHEPAKIIEKWSTASTVLTQEGDTVSLICNATGVPYPDITWYRIPKDGSSEKQRIGMIGEILIIRNVSRDCDDRYQCIAYNGVNPADSKVVKVCVEFAPEVVISTKRIGQSRNKDVILECHSTAFPQSSTFWTFNGDPVVNNYKYKVEIYLQTDQRTTLTLTIRDLEKEDFGEYTCAASNPYGQDQDTILVYELKDRPIQTTQKTTTTISPTTAKTSSPTTANRYSPYRTHGVSTKRFHHVSTTRFPGVYRPGNMRGTPDINIVTDSSRRVNPPGKKTSRTQSHPNNIATKSTYAGLFLFVLISAITSICACRRT